MTSKEFREAVNKLLDEERKRDDAIPCIHSEDFQVRDANRKHQDDIRALVNRPW